METKEPQRNGFGTTTLNGLLLVQRGQPILLSAMPPKAVIQHHQIDQFDSLSNPDGYQRNPVTARIRKAGEYYRGSEDRVPGLMPNPLLANIRQDDLANADINFRDGNRADYESAKASGGNWLGVVTLDLPTDIPIWIYDGQHRVGGIGLVAGDLGALPIPLSITLGLPREAEMREFYEVNTNAKSVKTDLAWELLRHMAVNNPQLAALLEETGRDWTVRGVEVVHELLAASEIWTESIQSPNTRRKPNDRLTVTQAQFVKSLRPVLNMPLLQKAPAATVARVVDAYWAGIAQIFPSLFAPDGNPKDYVIQKGAGVTAFHRVLPFAIETLRARGQGLGIPEAYAEVMSRLPELSGEIFDDDGTPSTIHGSEFWRSGSQGVAGQFSGEAGYKRLASRIQALMPKPSEEITL
ncbi:MAG: DGQHR domain-containing protein [Chloroflexi bacterium]|nr:DGQHR domain-containing protein [Chloroflexota bacterium]